MIYQYSRALLVLGALSLLSILLVSPTGVDWGTPSYMSAMYLLANIVIFAAVVMNPKMGGISLLVAFFFLAFVALPSNVQVNTGSFPSGRLYSSSEIRAGYNVLVVAQLSYLSAYWWANKTQKPLATNFFHVDKLRRYERSAQVALFMSVLVILYVGFSSLLVTRGERFTSNSQGIDEQLTFIGRSTSLFGVLTLSYILRRRKISQMPARQVALLSAFTVVFLLLNFPPALSRFQLLGSVLAILAIHISLFNPKVKGLFAIFAPLFLLYIFPAIKSLGLNGELSLPLRSTAISSYLTRVDFDSFQQIVDTHIYLENASLRWGSNFLGVALFWVPRSVWPNKPLDTGYYVSSGLGYEYTNVASPLPAESLASFGYFGVALVFFTLSYGVTRLEARVYRSLIDGVLANEVILYGLCVGFSVIVLRGSLNGTAPIYASGFIAYLALKRHIGTEARSFPTLTRARAVGGSIRKKFA